MNALMNLLALLLLLPQTRATSILLLFQQAQRCHPLEKHVLALIRTWINEWTKAKSMANMHKLRRQVTQQTFYKYNKPPGRHVASAGQYSDVSFGKGHFDVILIFGKIQKTQQPCGVGRRQQRKPPCLGWIEGKNICCGIHQSSPRSLSASTLILLHRYDQPRGFIAESKPDFWPYCLPALSPAWHQTYSAKLLD